MKTKRFNFRVSDTMDALIRKKANDANMSVTDYIVRCAVDKDVINYDGLKELTTQVKKLGNNVNQLLILSRQGKINTVNLTATQEELKRIYELLSETLGRRLTIKSQALKRKKSKKCAALDKQHTDAEKRQRGRRREQDDKAGMRPRFEKL